MVSFAETAYVPNSLSKVGIFRRRSKAGGVDRMVKHDKGVYRRHIWNQRVKKVDSLVFCPGKALVVLSFTVVSLFTEMWSIKIWGHVKNGREYRRGVIELFVFSPY